MKKIIISILATALAFGFISCKSTNQVQDLSSSFNKVYDNYLDALDLTGAETYTVKQGDTLTAITKSAYGESNGYYFPLIMLASKNVVQDPEMIRPGMTLTIPSLERNINNVEKAKALSPYFKDIAGVYDILKAGTAAANKVADSTLAEAKEAMKINYFDDSALIRSQEEMYNN